MFSEIKTQKTELHSLIGTGTASAVVGKVVVVVVLKETNRNEIENLMGLLTYVEHNRIAEHGRRSFLCRVVKEAGTRGDVHGVGCP